MSDSETLRAAGIMCGRGWMGTAKSLAVAADELEAEDAAKLKAAERDQQLAQVALDTFRNYWDTGVTGIYKGQGDCMAAVARAVREAIEAEQ